MKSNRWLTGWAAMVIAIGLSIIIIAVNIAMAPPATALAETKEAKAEKTTEVSDDEAKAKEAKAKKTTEVSDDEAKAEETKAKEEPQGEIVIPVESTEDVKPEELKAEESKAEESKPEEPKSEEYELHFYNSDIQSNGDASDDYNFGPNPIFENVSLEKVKAAIQGKSPNDSVKVGELLSTADTEVIEKDFRDRIRKDRALGAADMAWLDSLLGTRYLGVFYDECNKEWDKAMNKAKEDWTQDSEDYQKTVEAFFEFLDSATKVEVKSIDKKLSDQMYMNPYTKDKVPDIIVMETKDHSGWYLVYTFTIKQTKTVEVMYRVDCGYQPTDVAKVMNVTPKKKSSGGGTKSGGGGTKTGGGIVGGGAIASIISGGGSSGGGGGKNDPNNNPKKDPTKGTQVLPNDDKGPGPDTNGDPNWSSKDQPTNSNHMTQLQYQEAIKELQDANQNSREGGDSNEPSTSTPPDTTVDNNGDKGTGNGGIDEPTKESDSSVSDEPAGDSWDGPPD